MRPSTRSSPIGRLVSAVAVVLLVGGHLARAVSPASLAADVARVESVREIKDVTRAFAQLAQFGRWADAASLFASDAALVWGGAAKEDQTVAVAGAVVGPKAVEAFLRKEAGDMDGAKAGSLNLWVIETPVVSLAADGKTAKGRWNTLRFMGDGKGGTRIQGGIYENEYVLGAGGANDTSAWKFSLFRYYEMYKGDWAQGWRNAGSGKRNLPIVPYHFTPDQAGIPAMVPDAAAAGNATTKSTTAPASAELADLAARIALLNDEDAVRNLQHTYGYYLDQRMWNDVLDLMAPDATLTIDGAASQPATSRATWEKLSGPEGLARGVLNEHPMFATVVDVSGDAAVVRGIQMGMIGDYASGTARWEFGVYRNGFVRDPSTGVWRVQAVNLTNVLVSDYAVSWGRGGSGVSAKSATPVAPPAFIGINRAARRASRVASVPSTVAGNGTVDVAELQLALARSSAWDGSENDSSAYGYWADDIRCDYLGGIHAGKGHKESPGTGWFVTADRIAKACHARYGAYDADPQRGSVPFHWRPQVVVHVAADGRSAAVRARLLQFGTSTTGGSAFGGGMYSDQTVLEKETGLWKLWSTTIDEFYWQSSSWSAGWAKPNPPSQSTVRAAAATTTAASSRPPPAPPPSSSTSSRPPSASSSPSPSNGGLNAYPPDVPLTNPLLGPRELGFSGGPPPRTGWPAITTMWFPFRNPVSGRVPVAPGSGNSTSANYWPGCVPCHADGPRPEWSLERNGYMEPPTGP